MNKRIIKVLILFIFPLLIITGFSSWIIVGEKSETVATSPAIPVAVYTINIKEGETTKEVTKVFTRVEKALEDATKIIDEDNGISSVEVYVIPKSTPIITKDCTITSGVSLVLPYELSSDYKTATFLNKAGTNEFFADSTPTNINTYLLNNLILDNSTLTIGLGGTLTIGGVLGNDSHGLSGQTSGNYSQVTMKNKSKIVNYGNLNCYGYIKEDYSSRNTCIVESFSGMVTQPFVVYDFRGGTNTATVFKLGGISPFNVFDMPNCHVTFKLHSSSSLYALADLYANDAHNYTNIRMISTSNSVIKLAYGSFIVSKYSPKWVLSDDGIYYSTTTTDSTTQETIADDSGSNNYCRTRMDIYGDASTGSMKLTITFMITVSVSTADVFFPISWKYDIYIMSGQFVLNNQYKLMTGASLTIGEDATFMIGESSSLIIYNSFTDVEFAGFTYPSKSSGKFVNNGILNILGSFAGFVEADKNNGMISVESGATLSLTSYEGNSGSTSATDVITGMTVGSWLSGWEFIKVPESGINEDATAYVGSNAETKLSSNFYLSSNKIWNINNDSYTVNFYSIINNGSPSPYGSSTTATLKNGLTVQDPTTSLGNAKFVGWYFNSNFKTEVLNQKVLGSQLYLYSNNKVLNLYSRWTTETTNSVVYYDTYSSTAYPTSGSTYTKLPGQSITMNSGLSSYYEYNSDNSKRTVQSFISWKIECEGEILESSISPGSIYVIPNENKYIGKTIYIKPIYEGLDYYRLFITSAKYIVEDGVIGPETDSNGYYWVLPKQQVTIIIQGSRGSLFSKGYSRTCTITSGNVAWEGSKSNSFTAAGGGGGFKDGEVKPDYFVMPSAAVTITTS